MTNINITKADYNSLMETLYIASIPELKEDIMAGMKEDLEDCVDETEVEW